MKVNRSTKECAEFNEAHKTAIEVGLVAAHEPTPEIVARENGAKRHHGGWRNEGCAILPIGLVNLTTAKNAMFGTMWECWGEGDGTDFLVSEFSGSLKYRVVHTSGTMDSILVGDTISLKHDQTGARIGWTWNVVAKVPHTREGLLELKRVSGKSSLAFSTFK